MFGISREFVVRDSVQGMFTSIPVASINLPQKIEYAIKTYPRLIDKKRRFINKLISLHSKLRVSLAFMSSLGKKAPITKLPGRSSELRLTYQR